MNISNEEKGYVSGSMLLPPGRAAEIVRREILRKLVRHFSEESDPAEEKRKSDATPDGREAGRN